MNKKKIIILESNTLLTNLYSRLNKRKIKYLYYFNSYQLDVTEKNNRIIKSINHLRLDHKIEEKITFEANKLSIKYILLVDVPFQKSPLHQLILDKMMKFK